jgi:hypothetical protein
LIEYDASNTTNIATAASVEPDGRDPACSARCEGRLFMNVSKNAAAARAPRITGAAQARMSLRAQRCCA